MKLLCEKRKPGNMWNSNESIFVHLLELRNYAKKNESQICKIKFAFDVVSIPIKSPVTGVFQPSSAIDI